MKRSLLHSCAVLGLLLVLSSGLWGQPTITGRSPSISVRNVSASANITITFSEAMTSGTLTTSTIRVNGSQRGKYTGVVSYDNGTTTATFNPDSVFKPGEVISVTVTTGVQNASTVAMAEPSTWQFTVSSSPALGAFLAKQDKTTANGPNQVIAADVNKDGIADIVTVSPGTDKISVIMNNGNRTFAAKVDYTTGAYANALASGDFDADGDVDIVTANGSGSSISVFLNNGNGTFAVKVDYTAGGFPYSVTTADFDGDGDIDVVAGNQSTDDISVFLNNGNGTFATKVDYACGDDPRSIASADVNNDGAVDVIVGGYTTWKVSVLLNNGDGTFASNVDYTSEGYVWFVAAADVNGDGSVDLLSANVNNANKISVFLNNNDGSGTFASRVDYLAGSFPKGVTTADLDGDGDLDIAASASSGAVVSVLKNNGNGTFASKVDYTAGTNPTSVIAADFNGGGEIDLAVTNSSSNSVSVYFSGYSFTVNSTSDAVAANPGDGTAFTSGGLITLRSAVQEALADGTTQDMITIPAGTYTLSIAGKSEDAAATGDLDLKGNLIINGAGQGSTIIDANGVDRVFHIIDAQGQAAITISNLTMTGGDPSDDTYYTGGGAILLEDTVNLTLNNVTVDGNRSYSGAVNVHLNASSRLTINNSTFSNNTADGEGGALYGSYLGYCEINNSTFTNNTAQYSGGAISASFDSLMITSSSFNENSTNGSSNVRGGAIFVNSGPMTVVSCSFVANSAFSSGYGSEEGGAIHIYSNVENDVLVKNSSFRADSASDGGAICMYGDGYHAITIDNCNFQQNIALRNGGAIFQSDGIVRITNSTLDSNTASSDNGGAVCSYYGLELTMTNDLVRHNRSDDDNGGAMYVYSDVNSFSLKNSNVSNNYAAYNGGGIYSLSPIDTIQNVTVKHNTAEESGGGYMIDDNSDSKSSVWASVTVDSNEATGYNSGGGEESVVNASTRETKVVGSIGLGMRKPRPAVVGPRRRTNAAPRGRVAKVDNGSFNYGRGGGILDNMGGMTWDGGSLRGNTAAYVGGGLMFQGDQNSTIQSNVIISGNIGNGGPNNIQLGNSTGTLTSSTPIGAVYDSIPGNALSFDGVDDYAYMSSPITDMGNGFTMEAWVNPASLGSDKMVIYSSNGRTVQFGIDSSHHFFARFEQNYQDLVYVTGTTIVSANQWYHYAASVHPGDSLILYINGKEEASASVSGYYGGSGISCLGKMYHGDPQLSTDYHYFAGLIDEARLWNGVRTATQIRTYMHSTMSGTALNAVLFYFQMNEGTGASVIDRSNGNNLDLDQDGATYQPSWAASDAPVGGGTSTSASSFQSGTQAIGNASLTMADGFDNPVDVYVSETNGDPNVFPTNYNASVGGKYFVIELFGDPGTFSANLTLNFGAGVITSAMQTNPSTLKLFRRSSTSSGGWTLLSGAVYADSATGEVRWQGITSFSQFLAADVSMALPVELTSFAAIADRFDSQLRWRTATEVNNAGYEVHRKTVTSAGSSSPSNWSPVGFVRGSGTSNQPHEYSFSDKGLTSGRYAYRLKQMDASGAFQYSASVEVEIGIAPREFTLSQNYPNPFNPSTAVEFTLPEDGRVTLRVYNTLGQEVARLVDEELKAGVYQRATLDASRLASGVYFARLEFGGRQLMKKMLLVK